MIRPALLIGVCALALSAATPANALGLNATTSVNGVTSTVDSTVNSTVDTDASVGVNGAVRSEESRSTDTAVKSTTSADTDVDGKTTTSVTRGEHRSETSTRTGVDADTGVNTGALRTKATVDTDASLEKTTSADGTVVAKKKHRRHTHHVTTRSDAAVGQ